MSLPAEHPRVVALYTCGSFEHVGEQPTLATARAYCAGAAEGGSYFGDGVSAWVLPEDLDSIAEWLSDDFVDKSAHEEWERVKNKLPEWAKPTELPSVAPEVKL